MKIAEKRTYDMQLLPESERPRLLLVDDQPVNIQVLHGVFSNDHEVFFATNGRQAIKMAHTCLPDLILLDVVMPEMGGLEVCRQLTSDPETRDIPIIFVTGQDSPEDETIGLEAGAVDFITKPVNPAVVRARVKTHLTLKHQTEQLKSMVFVDGLTGVANRRRFDECLNIEWNRCCRHNKSLGLFMIDIDHFKKYNDLYGHQAGDVCLQKVAEILSSQVGRSYNLVARYGGEEFVCLFPGISMENAMSKARQMVKALYECALPHAASDSASVVTISLGVAVTFPAQNRLPEELVAAADAALYSAKQNGRNQISSRNLT
ncbi:MAG: diguanylate cyclase [Desulfuromonadaceae bacterium]|nr:diguanylate cyclase [Desulfuromonadaceae bacterium]